MLTVANKLIMLSVIMPNVVMLSFMAPERLDKGVNVCKAKRSSLFGYYTPKKFYHIGSCVAK
jgi:hypothetical protein